MLLWAPTCRILAQPQTNLGPGWCSDGGGGPLHHARTEGDAQTEGVAQTHGLPRPERRLTSPITA